MAKLTTEEWKDLTEEQQTELLEDSPETVPDSAKSEQDEGGEEKTSDDEGNEPGETDEDTVVYKGKEIPLKNLIGEHVRKALKDKDKDVEEYKELVNTLTKQMTAQPQVQDKGKYWEETAEKLANELIQLEENDMGEKTPKVNKEAIMELFRNQATLVEDIRAVDKQRTGEIKTALRKLKKGEKEVIGDIVESELEKYPLGRPIGKDEIDRTIAYARGLKQDRILEKMKEDMEANLGRKKKKIEGEVVDDDSFVPSGGKKSSSGSIRATGRQIKLAKERGIPVEKQVEIDEKIEKKKKKENK